MIPAEGFYPPGHQCHRQSQVQAQARPGRGQKLLAEAGFSPAKPVQTKISIAPSGSGQMQPLPMNEFVQQNLAEVGIKIDFEVVEWNTLINILAGRRQS